MKRRHLLMMAAGSFVLKGQEFEAASIKPSAPAPQMGQMRIGIEMLPGGRVAMSGVTVRVLVQQAYGVRDFQVIGGPAWLGTERYDITAKPEGAATPEQVKLMTQALLADRFKLKLHRETKELPTYALVVAKGGSKLKVADVTDGGRGNNGRMMMRPGHFEAYGVPISALVNQLSQVLRRSVIDKTELAGNYDFKLDWTPDESQQQGIVRAAGGDAPVPTADASGPSLFTVLQDELGLKLESTKGPVEVLVIESAEKASEN
jgi:uncharacterized protein (TIGR03435 family)